MADEVINTRIVAEADFSSLIADVHRVTSSLSKLQEQLSNSNKMLANNVAVINRGFADSLRSTGQFSSHFVSLQSNVETFGKSLDSGRLKLRDYFTTYQNHVKTSGGLIRQLAQQQVQMQNAILQPLGRNAQGLMQFNVHVPRGLDAIKSKTALASQELKIMNKVIQDGAVQLINWGKNTQWAGRQLTVGLTLPLASFGKAASDAFMKADQELTRLTKVYGGVAATSTQELKKIRNEVSATAAELSKQYGASFQDTISLAADIAATGKQGNDLLASTKETTRLAILGEVDRQDAMKATLALQTAFKQNNEELAQSINFLNAVENQTSTSLGDLIEAIPKAGPVIKGLGGSVKDLALYLTAMREGGISAAEGANALKSGLASLINPTDKAVGQFKSFGIDLLGIVSKNAGNVTGTLLELQGALDKLNPLQKQQAIENLFGKFQFARMNALFENLGKQGSQTLQVLDLMKASSADLADIASREMTQMTESASGKYRRALESLKADMAGVGEQFLTVGTKLINIIDKALKFFEALPKPVKSALTFIGALTALAGPLIMLTGLLANFFGYIIKGAMHMKAFLKGGEGWKYLTPEMMAASKAGKLVEQTFYSDAKAAAILQVALKNLVDEFSILEAKAKSGSISVQPAVSTMAGNVIMGAGQRVVNPNHPLAGLYGSRSSTHMVPRGSMTEEQRMNQTIFGLVPGAGPVNRKIGQNPQIYMNEQLPNVPGLTTIGGASTGVVAGEAARWHAMMATLGMQSKEEIANLKKTIATTGIVSKEFMQQFDQVLPVVSSITDNAAKESALIVGQLRAGKITVDQAKQQIVELNLQVERMISEAMTAQATAMGRTLNPTVVPTLNQPVVDATGKSNMRELFKKGKTKDLINKIAGSLGVRTSGAGYNIETTRPKRFATGGTVVPGPRSDTTDTQYMELNAGDFVLNRRASDNILGFNDGGKVPAMVTPGEIIVHDPSPEDLNVLEAYNNRFALGGKVMRSQMNYGRRGPIGYSSSDIDDLYEYLNYLTNSDEYDVSFKQNAILNDATALLDSGKVRTVEDAIRIATKDVEQAIKYSKGDEVKYRQIREIQARARGLNTGQIGRRQNVNAANRTEIATSMRNMGYTHVMDYAHRAHIDPISYTETNRGYYGQAVHDRWNSFSNTLRQRLPEIEDRVPVSSAGAAERADYIARHLGFEDHNDMLIREQEVRQIAATGRTPRGRSAPLGIFRFLRYQLPQAAVRRPALARFALGGMVGAGKNNYGIMNIGMPRSGRSQMLATQIASRTSSSRFRNVMPIDYGHLVQETSGHSFPIKGVGGIYKNPDGEGFVFVKPMMDETAALAELRATEIARRAHGLKSPRQTIRVMKDPTDHTGQRTFIVLQSPYDPSFAAGGDKFTRKDFFKQLVASLVRGDKDLSSSNVFGPHLADVGTAGVFSRASGSRSFAFNMPSMADQATVNLLGVRGGAKRAFAENTSGIARRMSPDQYHEAIISEINAVLPKMREVVRSFNLTKMERKVYERMIQRLEAGLHTDWRPYQQMHANVKPQKLALGGIVGRGKSNYGEKNKKQLAAEQAAMNKGTGKLFGVGMAASLAGSMMPQGSAQQNILMSIGNAASFAAMIPQVTKLAGAGKSLTQVFAKIPSILGSIVTGIVRFIKLNPELLIITATLTAAFMIFRKIRQDAEKRRENETAMFGLSKKGASELKIQYTTIAEKMKAVREEQKLMADKAKSQFQSYSSAGITGLSLTIDELRKAKEDAKKSMPETLKVLNNLDNSKINQWATNLKAQMIAGGKSVEEANNKIYALIESSNKAGMGVSVLTDKAFSSIKDKGSAAAFTMKTLADNLDRVTSINSEAFASNLDTAVSSMDAAVNALVGTKDATGKTIDEVQALMSVYSDMEKTGIKNKQLTEDALATIQKERPELAAILNSSDTIGGMYAKWRLYLAGVKIDLANISSAQAETLARFTAALDEAGTKALTSPQDVKGLEEAAKALKSLQDQYAKASAAAKAGDVTAKGLSKEAIQRINDEIKAIRKRADEKKKALQDSLNNENTQLQLQKLQLDYQAALARGDKDAAAQAQLSIRQLSKQYEVQKAMDQIDKNAKKEEDVQQGLLDKDSLYKAKLADAAAKAGIQADKINEKIKTVTDIGTELARIAKNKDLGQDVTTDLSNVLQTIAKSAKTDPKVLEAYGKFLERKDTGKKDKQGNPIYEYTKDKDKNYIPLAVTKVGRGQLIPGAAQDVLGTLATSMADYATEITGGTTLKQIADILLKGKVPDTGSTKVKVTTTTTSDGRGGTTKSNYASPTDLYNAGVSTSIGTVFSDKDGVKWKIAGNATAATGYQMPVTRMALGGYIKRAMNGVTGMMGSQPYLVGERGPELFVPSSGGQIIPNNILGAKYNVPSGPISSVKGAANNSYNNNVYNIDIALNGTNVTADDVMRKFKAELAMVNAREGRVRTVGGSV